MTQAINWFEIPVADLDRAQAFYQTLLQRPLRRERFGDTEMAVFSHEEPAIGGCLFLAADAVAAHGGARVYLDCAPSIDAALARTAGAGGAVIDAKTALPQGMGYIASVRDTEGNTVWLHAMA